ncbi:Cyclin-dependent kinase 9 [Fasciola gigantica]|uniref:Cyclin-dependent kinase 9 n=1 Tax=Fasciola gigantica TaxID=46835 RepID=A0A504YXP9_FASGI|nr:Cyclin-dependent kinase 9 [Fasciola gigantica]
MRQLLMGLDFLRKNNVLHRDLRTLNIPIDRKGVLKIADFGLARLTIGIPERPSLYIRSSQVWQNVKNLEAYQQAQLPKDVKRHVWEKLIPKITCPSAVDLIDKLIVLDPLKHLDADQALSHDFFHEDPPVADFSVLSKSGSSYLEYSGQVSRALQAAAAVAQAVSYRGVPPNPSFVHRRLPGPVGIPVQQGGGVLTAYWYRGLSPDQDSTEISDRIH